MVYNVPMCESETLDASHRDGIPTACGGSVVTATAAAVVMVEHGYLPYALIQLSCKGCCEKRERSLQPLWGARDFSFPLGVAERAGTREREDRRVGGEEGEKQREREAYPFPFSPISLSRRLSRGTPGSSRPSASQLGSHRAEPSQASQSVRGENFIKRFECVGRGFT